MQKGSKKWVPIACAVGAILVLAAYLAFFLFAILKRTSGKTVMVLIVAVYCVIIVAAIIGVIAALRQRLKEIDGGEEDAAAQY